MNCEIINLFPVLSMKFSNFLSHNECDILLSKYEKYSGLKQHDYFTNDAETSHHIDSSIVDEMKKISGFENLKDRINDTLSEYSKVSGFLETKLSNSWFNIQRKGSALYDHMHPVSYVSGCIYLNIPDGSNNIFFWNPNQFVNYIPTNTDTIYSSETYWIKPNKGDLLLFPGWIKHGSNGYKNNSDNRATIAFNSK